MRFSPELVVIDTRHEKVWGKGTGWLADEFEF
jgi:hypothetical protein